MLTRMQGKPCGATGDGARSFAPGRELSVLGRLGVTAARLEASGPVRRDEADGSRGPAPPGFGSRERPSALRSRSRTQEMVPLPVYNSASGKLRWVRGGTRKF